MDLSLLSVHFKACYCCIRQEAKGLKVRVPVRILLYYHELTLSVFDDIRYICQLWLERSRLLQILGAHLHSVGIDAF